MPATQANRVVAIGTPLGDDVLLLKSATVTEQLGRLFHAEAELLSEQADIDLDKIVGQNVTIRLELINQQTRYFNGFVSRFVQSRIEGGYAHYQATIVPWLWFLTRTADCRIFQQMKVPDIVEKVFRDHGFTDFKNSLSRTYSVWEYCVQYRETDFNFVSRLMEQEGFYYFFEHDNGKHTLVLADSSSAHQPFPGYDTIVFRPETEGTRDIECISDWTLERELQPGVYAVNDFNFKTPKVPLQANANITRKNTAADFEIYDYPGEYDKQSEGQDYAQVRIQELQANFEVAHGQADARGIAAGYLFTLQDHPRNDQNRQYLITAATCQIHSDEFESGGRGGSGVFYACTFTAIDVQQPFRSARITPKPIIQGPQTAIVVGPSGEEIYTDPDGYGQVKVQFHWDRYGKADENSSCWVRVSQIWAGKNWGAIYIPRVGQEVIVEFLEGDPDWPIITGRVYNAAAMPPYALPGEKTKSTLKSNSSKGGGGFNEIRFEDKKGSEQVFIHGEKNLDIRIKNDAFENIGNNRHLVVAKDRFEHVENNRHETVDNDHKEQIGNDRNLNVGGKEAKAVGGSLSLTVTGDVIEVFQGDHSEQVTSDYYLKADNIVIEAMTNLTIKVGQSYIAIESGGISIGTTGTLELQDSGGLTVQSDAQIQVDAPQTTVKGDATLTLKGGMVAIN